MDDKSNQADSGFGWARRFLWFSCFRYAFDDAGRLPVRAVRVSRQQLVNTISTNGRVEPVMNYPIYSPSRPQWSR